MRNSLKALVILAVLAAVGMLLVPGSSRAAAFISTGDGGWEQVYPPGPFGEKAFFLDANTGWVIIGDCRFLKTTDGGKNWAPQGQAIHKTLSDLYFTDKDHGWAVGRGFASIDPTGIILKTDDGGVTWRVVIDGKIKGLDAVCFVSNEVGWAVGGYPGNNGLVLKTTDGGETWFEQHVPTPAKGGLRFQAGSFVDENTGYVVACPDGQMTVYRTGDGGKTWFHTPGLANGYPRGIQFIDENTGWVLNDRAFLRTTDGGKTWTQTSFGKGVPDEKGRFIYSFHFADARNGIAANGSLAFRTRDGGKTWTPATLAGSPISSPQVYMADDRSAWIAGWGRIIGTSDGGANWGELSSHKEASTFHLVYLNPKVVWAAGDNGHRDRQGVLLKSEDGGLTWSRRVVKESRKLSYIFFVDEKPGWVTTVEGNILRTTDGGETWEVKDTGVKTCLLGVHFVDTLNGWAVGVEGTIIHTSDGGETWTRLNSGTMDDLTCVHFFNENTGIVGGPGGRIIKTTDGGVTWKRKGTGTNDYMADMQFLDGQTGWVSGTRGCILKTTDGGETWTRQRSNAEDQLTGIHFINEKEGWAGGMSTVVHTTDGGETWQRQHPGPFDKLADVSFADSDNGLAVGTMILRTTTGGLPGAVWTKKQPDGKPANFGHLVVTKKSEGYLLAEHPDSRVGIRIKTLDTKPNVGDYIYIHGKIATEDGEKIIAADSIDIMCAGWGVLSDR